MADMTCEDCGCAPAVWCVQWGGKLQYACDECYRGVNGGLPLSACPGLHFKVGAPETYGVYGGTSATAEKLKRARRQDG